MRLPKPFRLIERIVISAGGHQAYTTARRVDVIEQA